VTRLAACCDFFQVFQLAGGATPTSSASTFVFTAALASSAQPMSERTTRPSHFSSRARYSATAALSEVPKAATYTHAYAESNGFLTLLSDGERLTGAYALGPEAGEWLQQATLAIRARVPLDVLYDTIQPFPSFSGIYDAALKELRMEIADMPRPIKPMDAQMASVS